MLTFQQPAAHQVGGLSAHAGCYFAAQTENVFLLLMAIQRALNDACHGNLECVEAVSTDCMYGAIRDQTFMPVSGRCEAADEEMPSASPHDSRKVPERLKLGCGRLFDRLAEECLSTRHSLQLRNVYVSRDRRFAETQEERDLSPLFLRSEITQLISRAELAEALE